MSYIILNKQALVQTKLTAKGRENLAKGTLNYAYYTVGDSEVDYRYVNAIPEELSGNLTQLRPKDFQPNIKTFLTDVDCNPFRELDRLDLRVDECCVFGEAQDRGFFGVTGATYELNLGNDYIRSSGILDYAVLTGGNTIDLQGINYEDGDMLLIQLNSPILGNLPLGEFLLAAPVLGFRITELPPSTIVELDRNLPLLSQYVGQTFNYYILPIADRNLEFYSPSTQTAHWNQDTLEFNSTCDLSNVCSNVFNFNAVWSENLLGMNATHEQYTGFGSQNLLGSKEYFDYNKDCLEIADTNDCNDKLEAILDDFNKGIGIIHYSNLCINNTYAEGFCITDDETRTTLIVPHILWYNRYDAQNDGILTGMEFVSDGTVNYLKDTDIQYSYLIENPTFIEPNTAPLKVGKVFYNHKLIIVDNEELLASMSFKSNRNWALPPLTGRMTFPSQLTQGLIQRNKTLYLTYAFEADNGIMYTLPHQRYLKYINKTKIDRDAEFEFSSSQVLKYMRKLEIPTYDGLGFYAHKFKVLVQIVDRPNDRPKSDEWRVLDFTSTLLTGVVGQSINPNTLASGSADSLNFRITQSMYNVAQIYDLTNLGIPDFDCPEIYTFGDTQTLFGNVSTCIRSCIYRFIANIRINDELFTQTTNTTRNEQQPLYFTDIGIYNNNKELVMMTKIAQPVSIIPERETVVEISYDF